MLIRGKEMCVRGDQIIDITVIWSYLRFAISVVNLMWKDCYSENLTLKSHSMHTRRLH